MKKNIKAFLLVSAVASSSFLGTSGVNAGPNTPYIDGYSEGTFIKYENNNIHFEEYDGTIHNINFDGRTKLMIDDRGATIKDFRKGMDIYVELKGRKIVHMDSFSTDYPAHITKEGKKRSGIVKSIDRDQIVIITAIGTEETYFTSPSTITLQGGKTVSLNNLYVGDRVKFHFDDIDTNIASKVVIEGDSIAIKDLYRAEIAVTNRMSSVVTFNNVAVFRNGEWEQKENIRLPYNSDLPLYVAREKIDYKNIESYRGKTVYIALKDFFGRDGAEKMVVKNQYETTFSDKIEGVNWFTSEIKLSNTRNIGFNEGTMVIKNGRLVDQYSITSNSSALVVANGREYVNPEGQKVSSKTADVIYIYDEDINNSNIGMDRIYAGRVDSLGEYSLDLKDFFVLDKNKWESFGATKKLFFDNETFVYDLDKTLEDGQTEEDRKLTIQQFITGEYHVDENNLSQIDKDRGTRDYYAYIYTDGDRISGIYLMKQMNSLLRQTVTTASVKTAPLKNEVTQNIDLVLKDAKDWSERLEKWTIRSADTPIRIQGALIMKNGKRIKAEELKVNDRLYLVRDEPIGKIIVVK